MISSRHLCLLIFLFLVSCSSVSVNGKMTIQVHADGSGMYQFSLLTHPSIITYFTEYKAELIDNQFRIKEISEDQQVGWIATKHVDHIWKEPFPLSIPVSVNQKERDTKIIVRENPGFFVKEIEIDYPLDLTFITQEVPALHLFSDRIHFTLVVSLPVRYTEHNADEQSNDQKTATWHLRVGEMNRIYAKVRVPNPTGWVVTFLILTLALTLFIIFLRRHKKKETAN